MAPLVAGYDRSILCLAFNTGTRLCLRCSFAEHYSNDTLHSSICSYLRCNAVVILLDKKSTMHVNVLGDETSLKYRTCQKKMSDTLTQNIYGESS